MSSPFISLFALQWGELPDSYSTDFGYSTFCTLAFLWVLKRGYVTHANDGTDLRATLHSCEMWFRFKKKSDNKTMFAAGIHKRRHYIGVLLYEKHCRSALKKCWCEGREMKHWDRFLGVIYTQLVSFSFMQVLWFGHITASIFLCAQSCS